MFGQRSIFTSYGTLRICLMEAVDVFELPGNRSRVKLDANSKTQKVFATVSINDENDCEILKYDTSSHPYFSTETVAIGEEYIFEAVSSAYHVVVGLYSIHFHKINSSVIAERTIHAIGTVKIPIDRLEENTPVWLFLCYKFCFAQ